VFTDLFCFTSTKRLPIERAFENWDFGQKAGELARFLRISGGK
jgi:hypothetical protein